MSMDNQGPTTGSGFLGQLIALEDKVLSPLHGFGSNIIALILRIWLSYIFLIAGMARVKNWDSQEFLFTDIHPVPFLPGGVAQYVTTAGELVLPIFCALGFFGRASATGLLLMTMVIQFVVAQTPQGIENGIGNAEHYYWMIMAATLICYGPGKWSVDQLILNRK